MLGQVHKRSLKPQIGLAESFNSESLHGIKGSNEGWPAIGINKMISRVNAYCDNLCMFSYSHGICHREHHGIPVWHNSDRHIGRSIMTIRYRNCICERRSFEETSNSS